MYLDPFDILNPPDKSDNRLDFPVIAEDDSLIIEWINPEDPRDFARTAIPFAMDLTTIPNRLNPYLHEQKAFKLFDISGRESVDPRYDKPQLNKPGIFLRKYIHD